MRKLSVEKFITSDQVTLDVRSPQEYHQGHIPGAVSFPLFSDEERKTIGTIYKQQSKQDAFKEGLRLVGPKMVDFVSKAESFKSNQIQVYCWRGGMRSGSMGWLLSQAGFDISLMEGGYKRYRNAMLNFFQQPLDLRILTGLTGSGKTLILNELEALGAQIIDLEYIANHRGSSFGNALSTSQPTTEQFQNNLYDAFLQKNQDHPIWLEDESISIGRVYLPDALFAQMKTSKHYLLEVELDQRLDLLVQDYGQIPASKLKVATDHISKKLGHEHMLKAKEAIDQGNLREAARFLLTYYDRQYSKSIKKKKNKVIAAVDGKNLTVTEIAQKIMKYHGH
ncbi:MAG: tRNA 2-selenouridine(34) synthase MnmH [Bacteroidota bacterium]